MPRPLDPTRREGLLQAAIDYAIEHGLSDLTLRPLAEELGVMPNTLVHHFGSKEELLSAILNGVRDRLREMMRAESQLDGDPLRSAWRWACSREKLSKKSPRKKSAALWTPVEKTGALGSCRRCGVIAAGNCPC